MGEAAETISQGSVIENSIIQRDQQLRERHLLELGELINIRVRESSKQISEWTAEIADIRRDLHFVDVHQRSWYWSRIASLQDRITSEPERLWKDTLPLHIEKQKLREEIDRERLVLG